MLKFPNDLVAAQDATVAKLLDVCGDALREARLCGGTALSRIYLQHRVSYDLDFFLPAFSPTALAVLLKKAGLRHRVLTLSEADDVASQLHVLLDGKVGPMKVSFIEDAYAELYLPVNAYLGDSMIRTESIEGLYHRKLRTVVGHVSEGPVPIGHRQTARDLFDLWVLSHRHAPLLDFIGSLPYEFPVEALVCAIAEMPWFALLPEFQELVVAPEWAAGKDASVVRTSLCRQSGQRPVELDDQADDQDLGNVPSH